MKPTIYYNEKSKEVLIACSNINGVISIISWVQSKQFWYELPQLFVRRILDNEYFRPIQECETIRSAKQYCVETYFEQFL